MAASTLLRSARRRANLTQAQLGERAGHSQAEVARLERAGSNPTAATLERLLRATGHRLELRRLDAVDETQLRERLALTPAERIAAFQASQQNLMRLTQGARRVSTPDAEFDPTRLLRELVDGRVDFVAIGGMAAVLHGSARNTFDLDICFASDPHNLEALGSTLVALKARLRGVPERVPFVPDAAALKRVEVLTLATTAGDLDLLHAPSGAPRYDVLRGHADRYDVGGFEVRVASVEDLIAMKTAAGRSKDLGDIDELEAILRLRSDS
ncbi:MAG TPA: helix-turn-helix domain-containing protein [Solirubrobacteraceae bacterium]|nr:helix-turn-helix domain-containing protein [Solirubrobacteraceae bacterium]